MIELSSINMLPSEINQSTAEIVATDNEEQIDEQVMPVDTALQIRSLSLSGRSYGSDTLSGSRLEWDAVQTEHISHKPCKRNKKLLMPSLYLTELSSIFKWEVMAWS